MEHDYGFCHLVSFVTDHNVPLCPHIKYSYMGGLAVSVDY